MYGRNAAAVSGGVLARLEVELDGCPVERRPVVERDALADVVRPLGVVVVVLPGLDEHGGDVAVLGRREQRVGDRHHHDVARRGRARLVRHPRVGGVGADAEHEVAALHRLALVGDVALGGDRRVLEDVAAADLGRARLVASARLGRRGRRAGRRRPGGDRVGARRRGGRLRRGRGVDHRVRAGRVVIVVAATGSGDEECGDGDGPEQAAMVHCYPFGVHAVSTTHAVHAPIRDVPRTLDQSRTVPMAVRRALTGAAASSTRVGRDGLRSGRLSGRMWPRRRPDCDPAARPPSSQGAGAGPVSRLGPRLASRLLQ